MVCFGGVGEAEVEVVFEIGECGGEELIECVSVAWGVEVKFG